MLERVDAGKAPSCAFFLRHKLVNAAGKSFRQLAAVLRSAALYPPAHPWLLSSAEQLALTLETIFAERDEAAFMIADGELFFEAFSVPLEEDLSAAIEDCIREDIGSIVFKPGLTRSEIVTFARLMRDSQGVLSGQEGAGQLDREGVTHIALRRTRPGPSWASAGGNRRKASQIFTDAVDAVKEIVYSTRAGKALNADRIETVVHAMVDSVLGDRDALLGLSCIKFCDEYSFVHPVNVSILSMAMGAFLALEKDKLADLGISGMLHDIGKASLPLDIVNKADALTREERELMKLHPVEGAVTLAGMPGAGLFAIVAAFEHHLRYDLRGYPLLPDYPKPHPFSRIVAIADAYDALASARVYYGLSTPEDGAVSALLNMRGTVFDPALVKAFVNMVGIFPIGTLVELSSGDTGLVVRQTSNLLRPRVLLLRTYDGAEEEEACLLERDRGTYKLSITAAVGPGMKRDLKKYFM